MDTMLLQSALNDYLLMAAGFTFSTIVVLTFFTGSSTTQQESASESATEYVHRTVESVSGYHSLSAAQQEFFQEYGVDLSKRGYELQSDVNRVNIQTNDQLIACLAITDSGDIDIYAVQSDEWQPVESVEGSYTESTLKQKQDRLDMILENS